MKRNSALFLQGVTVLFGIAVMAALLREPWLEGVNANATGFADIYLDDPFLAVVYLGAVPFFVGLYQFFKVLGNAKRDKFFSQATLRAVRFIRNCAYVTASAIIAVLAYIRIMAVASGDDPAGFIMLGLIATLASIAVVAATMVGERIIEKGVDKGVAA